MNKEFIPYEQALALKELGFNEPCFGCYTSSLIPSNFTDYSLETEFGMNESPSDWVNSNFLGNACSAPLFQQAFRWFRETCDIIQTISRDGSLAKEGMWAYTIITDGIYFNDGYKTYEEAELACLQKLIEIVKNETK